MIDSNRHFRLLTPLLAILACTSPATAEQLSVTFNAFHNYKQLSADLVLFDNTSVVTYLSSDSILTSGTLQPPTPGSLKSLTPFGSITGSTLLFSDDILSSPFSQSYPAGNYTVTAEGPSVSASFSFQVPADPFPSALPFITPSSWSTLETGDVQDALTINLNSFVPSPNTDVTFADTQFSIFSKGSGTPAYFNVLAPGTTQVTFRPSQLAPGVTYDFTLAFVDFMHGSSNMQGSGVDSTAASGLYANEVSGEFTTASVPEPANAGLTAAGLTFAFWIFKRRRD